MLDLSSESNLGNDLCRLNPHRNWSLYTHTLDVGVRPQHPNTRTHDGVVDTQDASGTWGGGFVCFGDD